MRAYNLTDVADEVLLRDLAALVARDRGTTAVLLAHLAEVDARRLYRPAAHSSMFSYCVDRLHLSEDAAYKRIRAARAARRFPMLFDAVAEGRLHLSAVCLLAPHLESDNLDELVRAATHRSKAQIERWLVRRFSVARAAGAPTGARLRPIPVDASAAALQLAPEPVAAESADAVPGEGRASAAPAASPSSSLSATSASGRASAAPALAAAPRSPAPSSAEGRQLVPGPVAAPGPQGGPSLPPAAAVERFLLQLPIDKGTRDKLHRAQALLTHAIPSGDLSLVLDRALDALIGQLERRKFAATSRPRPASSPPTERDGNARPAGAGSGSVTGTAVGSVAASGPPRPGPCPRPRPRTIPAPVRRAVWERDQGQCTFTSTDGHRCAARGWLEFDHVEPFARGGEATTDGVRLRCRAHNQLAAEQAFGADFMRRMRDPARRQGRATPSPGP